MRNGELDAQLAAAQAEADEQRAAKDDAQAALARARSRIEDLTEEVMATAVSTRKSTVVQQRWNRGGTGAPLPACELHLQRQGTAVPDG